MRDIPTSWSWSTIGELAQYIQRGKSPKYTERSELPVINQKCIRWNQLELQHLKFIHPEQFAAWDEARYIAPGDILWNSTGTGTVGRAYLVSNTDCVPPKVVDSHVTIVRHAPGIDARYLFNWIKGPAVQSKIEEMCDGTTNQIELSRSAIAATRIPVAPLEEQTRIADKLDAVLARVDACRDRLDRIPAILKRFRQAVLAAATDGRLTEDWRADQVARMQPQAESGNVARDAAELRYHVTPDSATLHPGYTWTVTTLGKCGAVSGGLTKNGNRNLLSLRKPYLRVANVYANRLVLDDVADIGLTEAEHTKTRLVSDDLLIVEGNGSLEQLGRVALWQGELEDCVHQNHLIRWRTTGPLAKFVLFWLMSPLGRNDLMELASTTTGLHTLSISKVSALPIKLPSLAEQTEIVRQVETLFAYADRLEARYQTARAQVNKLTPALLAKAFRGELVPQDPNDEPASALLELIRSQHAAAPRPTKRVRKTNTL